MAVLQTGLAKSLAEDYTIDQSLRFDDGDSAYLHRTFATAGNRDSWTYSCWFKLGDLSGNDRYLFSAGTGNSGWVEYLRIQGSGVMKGQIVESGTFDAAITTNALFRDVGAWYHAVWVYDSANGTAGDRQRLYINGERVTSFSSETTGTQNQDSYFINTAVEHTIGQATYSDGSYWDGYMAEVYFIDGQSLDADSFGETDTTTNQWKPIDASDLTFGTNGFYEKFASTELANSFSDSSMTGRSVNCDILVVGGGGSGGGAYYSGGGGAGGFAYYSQKSIDGDSDHTVTIGAGGAAQSLYSGNDGSNSSFGSLTAAVGGGGGGNAEAGRAGGSGGGGGQADYAGGSATANQGFAGGAGGPTSESLMGGGGGASEVGTDGTASSGGDGGDGYTEGTSTVYDWTLADGTTATFDINGTGNAYAGGGGGAVGSGGDPVAPGGAGGGGSGGKYVGGVAAVAGTANTGGGGGGGSHAGNASGTGAAGGSGVVIVRYDSSLGTGTGGTVTSYTDGGTTYAVHTFTASGTFSMSGHTITANGDVANTRAVGNGTTNVTSFTSTGSTTWVAPVGVTSVDYLVVGGGAGGGGRYGGGGGAGGFRTATGFSVTPGTSYTVTVGAGGAGGVNTQQGTDGGDSVFSTITSDGGGGGGAESAGGGKDGASGGGGAYQYVDGEGSGVVGQGYDGGTGVGSGTGYYPAGGGGGSSAVGADAEDGGNGGDGGAGTASSISGSSVTYAGGGGGSTRTGRTAGVGGSGGGGDGAETSGNNGSDATGYGSGGGGGSSAGANGGAGSDGIVILKYTNIVPGTSSIAFDGTGDYLSVAASSDWVMGSGEWTVENWVYNTATTNSAVISWSQRNDAAASPLPDTMQIWGETSSGATTVTWSFRNAAGSNQTIVHQNTFAKDTWVHIAAVRSSNTVTLYLDGVASTSTYDATGEDMGLNRVAKIGTQDSDTSYALEGYMDEFRLSNTARYTSAFTPSTTQFTADANTMLLIHSNWDGGLGADSSGNANDFTPTNLVATDQMKDSPTNNFATLNPLVKSYNAGTLNIQEGNLETNCSSINWQQSGATVGVSSGKWYWEVYEIASGGEEMFGIAGADATKFWDGQTGAYTGSGHILYYNNGQTYIDGSAASYGATYTTGDIIGIALDMDGSQVTFYKNNSSQGAISFSGHAIATSTLVIPANVTGGTSTDVGWNFGQDSSFAGNVTAQGNQDGNEVGDFYYEPPSGYLALCTDNLSDPEIKLPGDNFNTIIYSGDDANPRTLTGVGFQPDFTWIKSLSGAYSHQLFDAVRGVGEVLYSNNNSAEYADSATGHLSAWTADGYTVSGSSNTEELNDTGQNYVAWNWLGGNAISGTGDFSQGTIPSTCSRNVNAGFSIVSYTGNNTSGATVGHGLSEIPELIIIKNLEATVDWIVYSEPVGPTKGLQLNGTGDAYDYAAYFNDTAPTASVFSLGDYSGVNAVEDMIAYCFHSIEGYSKVGSYTGNGNANGGFVYTGFQPAYVLVKAYTQVYDWYQTDNKATPINVRDNVLYPNSNAAHGSSWPWIDFVSNGFKLRTSSNAVNNYPQLYIAFASHPFKYSNAV